MRPPVTKHTGDSLMIVNSFICVVTDATAVRAHARCVCVNNKGNFFRVFLYSIEKSCIACGVVCCDELNFTFHKFLISFRFVVIIS